MAISSGKYAKFISDRSGQEFPYSEMVIEWNGARVHISELKKKQNQNHIHRCTRFIKCRSEEQSLKQLDLNFKLLKITNGSTTKLYLKKIMVDLQVILLDLEMQRVLLTNKCRFK